MHLTSPLFGAAMLATLILATPAPGTNRRDAETPSPARSCQAIPRAVGGSMNRTKRATQTQQDAPWSLALIAQPGTLTTMGNDKDGPDGFPKRAGTQDWKFPYDDSWGEGVLVYVVDSGVRKTHVELAGRVEDGWVLPRIGGSATDDACNHGTGVAALIAGNTLGIARKATIVPVKISDDKGCTRIPSTTEDVTAGVNWAVSDYNSFSRRSAKGGIINISWETYQTDASQKAFEDAIAAGMHIVVSAGNFDQNQCFGGPAKPENARVKDVGQLIVGATDWSPTRFSFLDNELGSNYGEVVPDVVCSRNVMNIAKNNDDNAIVHGGEDETGTSFSTPLAAGTIAALISSSGNRSPQNMKNTILQKAVNNAGIKDLMGSPDILLQSVALSDAPQ